MLIAQPTETLLVSANASKLAASLKPEAYHVHNVEDPGKAMETLRDGEFDLIMLDDALFDDDISSIVREIKRRYPLVPVLVFSENPDSAYQTDLMEAGADDLLPYGLYGEEFHRRMRLLQQQRRQNRALARRNQNLHAIASLSRKMHSATDPQTLIRETIDLASKTFRLYGIAIVLEEGDELRLYAGHEGVISDGRLYEGTMQTHEYDPFRRVIEAGNRVQVFRNIRADSYYTPIPTLENAESVIIVPLNYQDYTLGAIGVFGTENEPLTNNDLPIYELFAAQFTTALQNARHYLTQSINVRFSKHLLRAWQRFSTLDTFVEIAKALRELIDDVPGVGETVVWLYPDLTAPNPQLVIDSRQPKLLQILEEMHSKGSIDELIEQMGDLPQLTLRLGRGQKDPLGPLFREMRMQQLILFPITDSARLIGGVIAGAAGSRQFSIEDADLMKSLAHAAGQALERTTLTSGMTEKSGRLEAILRSISEGIFFVDADGKVAFCNPQFTELTNITPSEVLNQNPDILLENLAGQSSESERVLRQLKEAIATVLDDEHEAEDYPIVEITLTNPDREIHVEFIKLSGLNDLEASWTGIIRNNLRFKTMFGTQTVLLDMMSERIRVPYAQIRGMITTLIDQHGRFSNRERARFLRQIERTVENLGSLWENFLEMYNLEISGLALNREETDLYDLIQRVLDSRAFNDSRRRIRVEAPAKLPLARVDELRIEKAIANILQCALDLSPKSAPLSLKLENRGAEIRMIVQDQSPGLPPEQVERLFEPFQPADDEEGEETTLALNLYVSRELVRRHGGQIWVESAPGRGTTMTLALPVSSAEEVVLPRAPLPNLEYVEPATVRQRDRGEGYSVPARQPKTVMSVEGRSDLIEFLRDRLEDQGYELLVYDSGEEALRDINAIRIDLILLDVSLRDANSLDICERIRKRTPVPIIMIADEPSEAEKVRSFELGADEYIARPMSNDEAMARVNGILKRRTRVEEVTLEPLDLGDLYIDFARREVFLSNLPLELTRIEYDLLHTLAINEGHVLTHKQLLEKVWGPEYQGETQYLWVNVSRLRKKLEPSPDSPRYIHTQQGVGYEFRRP